MLRQLFAWSLFAGRANGWKDRRTSRLAPVSAEVECIEPRVVLSAASVAQTGAAAFQQEVLVAGAARIINGTATSAYPAVGLIGADGDHFCSGTLIAPQYVLTAGHCAEGVADTAGQFTVGGRTYLTERVFVHPGYTGDVGSDSSDDIALYKLREAVVGIAPLPIFRGTPQVGQLLTLVGFGGGGTGNTGSNGDFGTKRVGTTPIDEVSRTLISWNFDNNTESNTAPGDSGGPAFVTVNGVQFIAGVTSGGDSATAGIGDHSFDTRVDAYASWIDSIVGTASALPTLSIVATDANAAETLITQAANSGTFTITRTGSTSAALSVLLSVSGTAVNGSDYSRLPATVTIAAGQASTTLTLTPIDDTLSESTESVTVTLANSSAYNIDTTKLNGTVTIADNDRVLPSISVVARDATAAETRVGQTVNRGQFTISRTGSTAASLTLAYSAAGTATNGTDYSRLSGTVTVPVGQSSVSLNVSPVDDSQVEGTESVVLRLSAGSAYVVDPTKTSATVELLDNEAANRTNDHFANSQALTGTNVTVTGNNAAATAEAGEPNPGGISGSKSVWWSWTANSSGVVTLSTAGSNFDTTLGVYAGSSLTSLQLVTDNDDENFSSGIYTSRLTFNAVAGATYRILVNGYNGDSGNITLSLTQSAASFARQNPAISDAVFADYRRLLL
ncbi:MAG: trypsin-like serine protease [Planctomycetaceae bacterium]